MLIAAAATILAAFYGGHINGENHMNKKCRSTSISVLPATEAHLGEIVSYLKSRGYEAGRSAAVRYAVAETARDINAAQACEVRRA